MTTQRETTRNRRRLADRVWPTTARTGPGFGRGPVPLLVALGLLAMVAGGCVSQGDFLRLREEVSRHHKGGGDGPDPFARIAQLSAEVDAMRQEIRKLEGELEMARKDSADALAEIQRTRTTLALQSVRSDAESVPGKDTPVRAGGDSSASAANAASADTPPPTARPPAPPPPDQELVGYQRALDAWRSDDYVACIENFTTFLQSYPTSGYADDAAYWLADCTYKHEEFKRAVIRFSDVVRVYPDSPKAPDALYRQGESLLKLGPRFKDAARTVFKRVQTDYPDSERAAEAGRQLERLGPSS